ALVGGNRGDHRLELVRSSGGQVELECRIFFRKSWGGHAEQAGVQVEQVGGGGLHALGGQAKIDGIVDLNGVVGNGLFLGHGIEAVLRGILGHDGDGQNDGDVVAGFLGQGVAAVEFPEIGVAGALDGVLDGAGAGVIGGHGQVPVSELVVEVFEVVS